MSDILVDIDGTVANCEHRLHHIREKPKNFRKFMEACPDDTIIEPVRDILRDLDQFSHNRLVFCTGRSDLYRKETEDWIHAADLSSDAIYMRTQGDYRHDDIVKSELIDQIITDGYKPVIAKSIRCSRTRAITRCLRKNFLAR